MRRMMLGASALGFVVIATVPSSAQVAQQSQGMLGGLSGLTGGGGAGLLGGLMPNVGGSTVGNAAGVLSYCVKNNILGGANATSVLGRLTGRQAVTSSSGFAAGQSGQVVTGQGSGFSLDSVKGKVKTKVCDLVLQHARSFVGGSAAKIGG